MAGVGDEIDPHPLGGIIAGLVDQVDDAPAVAGFPGAHFPALVGGAQANELDRAIRCGGRGPEPGGGGGVADRHAHVLADDMLAEQRARGVIGEGDDAGAHQQDRFDHRVERFAHQQPGIGIGRGGGGGAVLARPDRRQRCGDPADQARSARRPARRR